MNRVGVFHELARLELLDAAAHYESARRGLGRRFANEVQRSYDLACSRPEAGRVVEVEIRIWLLRGFPYSLVYRSRPEQLLVLAIAYQKREPLYWTQRR